MNIVHTYITQKKTVPFSFKEVGESSLLDYTLVTIVTLYTGWAMKIGRLYHLILQIIIITNSIDKKLFNAKLNNFFKCGRGS